MGTVIEPFVDICVAQHYGGPTASLSFCAAELELLEVSAMPLSLQVGRMMHVTSALFSLKERFFNIACDFNLDYTR
jgi:hypothetical protein